VRIFRGERGCSAVLISIEITHDWQRRITESRIKEVEERGAPTSNDLCGETTRAKIAIEFPEVQAMRVVLVAFLLLAAAGVADVILFDGTYRAAAIDDANYRGQAFVSYVNRLVRNVVSP
jgi:hypothetical protein